MNRNTTIHLITVLRKLCRIVVNYSFLALLMCLCGLLFCLVFPFPLFFSPSFSLSRPLCLSFFFALSLSLSVLLSFSLAYKYFSLFCASSHLLTLSCSNCYYFVYYEVTFVNYIPSWKFVIVKVEYRTLCCFMVRGQ